MIIISHSYKKTPWCGDHKGTAKKRMANKTVRMWCKQHNDIPLQNGAYKKLYEQYNICDYGCVYTWEQHWRHCQRQQKSGNRLYENIDKKEEYRYWRIRYKNK